MGSVKSTHKQSVHMDKQQKKLRRFMSNPEQKFTILHLPDGRCAFVRNMINPKIIYMNWLD